MPRRRTIVAPVMLILLGLAFMAQNLGLVDWNLWALLWQLWPIWLIGIGLELLVGRRFEWGSWAVLGLVLLLMGGTVGYGRAVQATGNPGEPVAIMQPVGDAARAEVIIDSSVTELSLKAQRSPNLVEGRVVPLRQEWVEQQVEQLGDSLRFRLRSRGMGGAFPFMGPRTAPSWDLYLSDQVPLSLEINTGVGESSLDLTGLKLSSLDLDAGVGSTEITLPAAGSFTVRIDSGVGEVILRIPKGLATEIEVEQGLGEIKLYGDFQRDGKRYRSPGFTTAADRAEIQVNGGIGEIRIEAFN